VVGVSIKRNGFAARRLYMTYDGDGRQIRDPARWEMRSRSGSYLNREDGLMSGSATRRDWVPGVVDASGSRLCDLLSLAV